MGVSPFRGRHTDTLAFTRPAPPKKTAGVSASASVLPTLLIGRGRIVAVPELERVRPCRRSSARPLNSSVAASVHVLALAGDARSTSLQTQPPCAST